MCVAVPAKVVSIGEATAASIPANVDLANAKKIGPVGMLSAGFNTEVKEGLGVLKLVDG